MNLISTFKERSPWLPNDAVTWRHGAVKYFYQIELGRMLQNEPASSRDLEVPYLKAQHVQWGNVRLKELPTMWAAPKDIEILRVHEGDLLVCEGGEVGRSAIVQSNPPENCIIQNALHLVRGKQGNNVRFLGYLLRHAADQGWFDVLCNRATIAHFTVDKFGEIYFALPGIDEQSAIAEYLDRETARIKRHGLLVEGSRGTCERAINCKKAHQILEICCQSLSAGMLKSTGRNRLGAEITCG